MSDKRTIEEEALTKAVRYLTGLLEWEEGGATLAERAEKTGFPPELLARLVTLFSRPERPRLPSSWVDFDFHELEIKLRKILREARDTLIKLGEEEEERKQSPEAVRARADQLADVDPETARILIAHGRDGGRWETGQRLCELCDEAAATHPERARELARLALAVATRVENEDPAWQGNLRAQALERLGGKE